MSKYRRLWVGSTGVLIAVLLPVYTVHLYNRPIPVLAATVQPTAKASTQTGQPPAIAWPEFGQSAVGIVGQDTWADSAAQRPPFQRIPTASTAKLMTALAVLDKKPLRPGQTGPMITITAADVDDYNNFVAQDGSVVPVQAGQQISEYDALRAMLLPSANNIADLLARWAFGSAAAYTTYANTFAKQHAMPQSNFADASGFSSQTVSTANDLVRLGVLAAQNPLIADIASKRTATIKVGDTDRPIYNVNILLGKYGITGLKTGNTNEAGGVFVASAVRQVNGKDITLVAAVMGAPDLSGALHAAPAIFDSAAANLEQKTLAKAGQSFGSYYVPWSKTTVKAVAARDQSALLWKNSRLTTRINLNTISVPLAKDTVVGNATIINGSVTYNVPLVAQEAVAKPGFVWRLNR